MSSEYSVQCFRARHSPLLHYSIWTYDLFSCLLTDSLFFFFFFSSRRRHTRSDRDWSSDVCSSDLSLGDILFAILEMMSSSCRYCLHSGLFPSDSWLICASFPPSLHFLESHCGQIGRASCRERV